MAISTAVKDRPASNRYMLVRLEPAFYAVDDLAATGTANLYDATFEVSNVSRVTRNGVELTEVSDEPNSDGEWRYVESTKKFELYTTTAPHESNANIVVYYYIFLTGEKPRYANADPLDTNTGIYIWEPLLENYPTINSGLSSVQYGVVSASNINLSIIYINDHIFTSHKSSPSETDLLDFSLSEKECKIWLAIDDQYLEVFTGTTKGINYNQNKANITVYDEIGRLEKQAFMGDSKDDVYLSDSTTGITRIFLEDSQKPIKYVFGVSGYNTFENIQASVSPTTSGLTGICAPKSADPTTYCMGGEAEQAYCIDYDETADGTTNRQWILGRMSGDGLRTTGLTLSKLEVGVDRTASESISFVQAINRIDSYPRYFWSGHKVRLTATKAFGSPFSLLPGDCGRATAPGVDVTFIITSISESSGTYTIFGIGNGTGHTRGTYTSSLTYYPKDQVSICISDDGKNFIHLMQDYDYTLSEVSLPSGNKYAKVTLNNSFEYRFSASGVSGIFEEGYLNPFKHKMYYRMTTDLIVHAECVKEMVTQSGLTADSTTFNDIKWDQFFSPATAHKVAFTIPNHKQSEIKSYGHYISDVSKTVFSILKTREDGVIEYIYPQNNESIQATIDESEQILNNVKYNIKYADISPEWRPSNSQLPFRDFPNAYATPATYSRRKYLHGFSNKLQDFTHVGQETVDRPFLIRTNRIAEYTVSSATSLVGIAIGDRITLNLDRNMGGNSVNVYVIEIMQTPTATTLKCISVEEI